MAMRKSIVLIVLINMKSVCKGEKYSNNCILLLYLSTISEDLYRQSA